MTDQSGNFPNRASRSLIRLVLIGLLSLSSVTLAFIGWIMLVQADPAEQPLLYVLFIAGAILMPLSVIALVGRLRPKQQPDSPGEASSPGEARKQPWEYRRADIDPMRVALWLAIFAAVVIGGISLFSFPGWDSVRTLVQGTPSGGVGARQDGGARGTPAGASGPVAAPVPSVAEVQFRMSGGIATDGVNLYAADSRGNRIRKIALATGAETILAGSGAQGAADGAGVAASFIYPTGVAVDGGNLYVADTANNKIRKIVIATGEVTTLAGSGTQGAADGAGAAASFNAPSGIAAEGGSLYVSDSNNRAIRKIVIASAAVTTLAGSGAQGSADGTGKAAQFDSPRGMALERGILYVADGETGKPASIRKIVVASGAVTTLAATDPKAAVGSSLGITTDGTDLYMADGRDNKIVKITIATGAITTVARGTDETRAPKAEAFISTGLVADGKNLYAGDAHTSEIDRIALANGELSVLHAAGIGAGLDNPSGITADGDNLYVADSGKNQIRKINLVSGTVSTLAGWEAKGYKDGQGTAALFNYPMGIACEGGSLYVADTNNNLIRKIVLATGEVTTLAGSGAAGAKDGEGATASFNYPTGIVADGGNLYVADSDNHVIRKIAVATGAVTTLAGSGAKGFHDGTGKAASFNVPRGILVDRGNLYVADAYNNAVRKIVVNTGVVTTVAGAGDQGAVDAAGKGASFRLPSGIAVDGDALYLADTNNQTIRRVALNTAAVTTVGGSGTAGANDGSGKMAAFGYPFGIVAAGGVLYVADSQNNKIRKIALASGAVTTLAGPGNQPAGDASGKPKTAAAPPEQDVDPAVQEND